MGLVPASYQVTARSASRAGTVVAGRERQILKRARGRCTKGSTLGSQTTTQESSQCTDSAGPRYTTHALMCLRLDIQPRRTRLFGPAPWVETPGPFPIFCGLAGWADQGPLITAAGAVRLPIAGGRTYGNANQSITLIGSPINLRRSQQG